MAPRFDLVRASRSDATAVHRLLQELADSIGEPQGIAGTSADLERFGFGETPLFEAWIARVHGREVGLLLCFPEYSSWRGRPGIYVQDLFVGRSARGIGIATALLRLAARRAVEIGGTYLRLSVHAENRDAQAFYRSAGFELATDERMLVLEQDAFARLLASPKE